MGLAYYGIAADQIHWTSQYDRCDQLGPAPTIPQLHVNRPMTHEYEALQTEMQIH